MRKSRLREGKRFAQGRRINSKQLGKYESRTWILNRHAMAVLQLYCSVSSFSKSQMLCAYQIGSEKTMFMQDYLKIILSICSSRYCKIYF